MSFCPVPSDIYGVAALAGIVHHKAGNNVTWDGVI